MTSKLLRSSLTEPLEVPVSLQIVLGRGEIAFET